MITRRIVLAVFAALFAFAASTQATIIQFDLLGSAGPGLLPGNETPGTPTGNPGTGGELGTGILFDDVTLQLAINIGWGSGNGFTDLTGNATAGHIHQPTPSLPPASFNESTGVLITLSSLAGWNPSATNGGFNGTVTLTSVQATALMEGRLYINVHTATNGGGEIRGNMIQVPEPSTTILLGVGIAGAAGAFWKRRRARK